MPAPGKDRALLIVDLQRGFNPTDKQVKRIAAIAPGYGTIVATQFVNGNPLFQRVLSCQKISRREASLVGLPKPAQVFKKTGYGLPAPLLKYLKAKKIARVDVCGLQTDACVLAAMYSLWDAGIEPNLLKDISLTPDIRNQRAALRLMRRNFGGLL